ncbi:GNAT family N-acetyltransferase [Kibdelosporangium persicum]|uniref:N-acetyltransferase n=2 Tax=Kibdelosporangium persicum TaxID=2698649 RepID=A0ABX2FDK1_9PSEU|nr:N-acetyltransferase [Kibdelosporangium persicum]
MKMSAELTTRRHDSVHMRRQRDALLDVYREVYADRLANPFFTVERFWQRLEAYAARDGFSLVTGHVGDVLVGYTLGHTLPPDARWWNGFRGEIDHSLLDEDGRRTFAVNELMVLPEFRRRGYAHALHNALLHDRPEERATLLVRPDNIPARTAYLNWGWYKLGDLQPFDDAPVYEALIVKLNG